MEVGRFDLEKVVRTRKETRGGARGCGLLIPTGKRRRLYLHKGRAGEGERRFPSPRTTCDHLTVIRR